jgi:hypothetical protein
MMPIQQIVATDWFGVWIAPDAEPYFVEYKRLAALALIQDGNEMIVEGITTDETGLFDVVDESDRMFLGYTHPKIMDDGPEQVKWRNLAKTRIDIVEEPDAVEEKTD